MLIQLVALLLTLLAWGADVLHIMHLGAEETLAEHHATTGNEEPDSSRPDSFSDEPAIVVDVMRVGTMSTKGRHTLVCHADPSGDDHSRDLMRPPQT